MEKGILREGRNCWKIARSSRVKFLIDGGDYFAALADAMERARESIVILGWDFDSRIRLKPQSEDSPDVGAFLNDLVRRQRRLQVHVLIWDFAMIYALGQNAVPVFASGWRSRSRIQFRMDAEHPVGASLHVKLVVIDDAVAFAGGLDLARGRWDTPEHRPEEPARAAPSGAPLPPHHDVQILVDGGAAAALGRLARKRWLRATGRRLSAGAAGGDPWPAALAPDLTDVDVAIVRTEPLYKHFAEVREIEALHRDAIAAARRLIYMENQYFSSAAVGEALERRLQEKDGPEIILVLSEKSAGWLEEATLDVLRSRLLKRLRAADRFRRLRVYCPAIGGLRDNCMSVHSKVMTIDDRLVRVGSANLNNRSMGLDTECDLAIESAGDGRVEREIRRFRERLLAEHLGVEAESLAARATRENSWIAAVDSLIGGQERTLRLLDGSVPEWLDRMIPESAVVDPERPIAAEQLIEEFVPPEERRSTGRTMLRGAMLLALLLGLAAAWRWTALREWLSAEAVSGWVAWIRGSDAAPLYLIAAYVIGGLVAFPVTILIAATAFVFGPWSALAYSLIGCLASALALHAVGYAAGRQFVARLVGRRLKRLNRLIVRHGVLAVATIRLIPIAPFSVVNLVAGAARVPLRDFALGTLIGMAPGIVGISFFGYQLRSVIHDPGPLSLAVLAAIVSALLLAVVWFRRRLGAEESTAQ